MAAATLTVRFEHPHAPGFRMAIDDLGAGYAGPTSRDAELASWGEALWFSMKAPSTLVPGGPGGPAGPSGPTGPAEPTGPTGPAAPPVSEQAVSNDKAPTTAIQTTDRIKGLRSIMCNIKFDARINSSSRTLPIDENQTWLKELIGLA